MTTFTTALTIATIIGAMLWYLPLIILRRIEPAPSSWLSGCLAMNLAMVVYHLTPGSTFSGNVLLYISAIEITIVLAVLMITLWCTGRLSMAFDWLQQLSLVAVAIVLIYWATNQDQTKITYWTTQAILAISYLATIGKVLQKKEAFDSIGNWVLIMTGSIVSLIPAFSTGDLYGIGNSLRATFMSGATVCLLIRFDRRNDWKRWKDETEALCDVYLDRPRLACANLMAILGWS